MKREPKFCNWMFQHNIEVQYGIEPPKLPVPINNAKEIGQMEFHPNAQNI